MRLGTVNGDKSQQTATTAMRGSNAQSFCGSCDVKKTEALHQSYKVNVREFRRSSTQVQAVYDHLEEMKSGSEETELLVQHGLKAKRVRCC